MTRKLLLALALLALTGSVGAYFYVRLIGSPFETVTDDPIVENVVKPATKPNDDELMTRNVLASLPVMTGQPFPSLLPWEPLRVLGEQKALSLEEMLERKVITPLEFLEITLKHYERTVDSYRMVFLKQERIDGKLHPPEKVICCFREKPFSAYMQWVEGARLALKSLYVKGENDDKLLGLPNVPFFPITPRPVDGWDAKKSGRYFMNDFGFYKATQRTIASMRKAQAADKLHVRFEGMVRVEKLDNRLCYKLVRMPYDPPEEDQINELVLYVDQETLLQTGSVLRDVNNQLIAEYFFRDIEINPVFDEKQFTREALKR